MTQQPIAGTHFLEAAHLCALDGEVDDARELLSAAAVHLDVSSRDNVDGLLLMDNEADLIDGIFALRKTFHPDL